MNKILQDCEEIAYRSLLENPEKCKEYLDTEEDSAILALFIILNEKLNSEIPEYERRALLQIFTKKLFKQ